MDFKLDDSFIEEFYNTKEKFLNFKYLTLEEIDNLKEQAKEISIYLSGRYRVYARRYGEYIDTIKHLLSLEQTRKITCDQRMFLFIILMDPKLEIYDIYMRYPLHSDEEIDKETIKFNRDHLIQENIRRRRFIDKTLKDILGYEDEEIIKYEMAFKMNILCRDKINVDVCKDFSKDIWILSEEITNLDDITNERFGELIGIAHKIKEDIKPLKISVLTHALLKQNDLLGVNVGTEQVLLYLLVMDEFFHLIDIYEEESKYQQIKLRALDELGFYSKNLIMIEKMMIEKFYPSKKEANWMLLKSSNQSL